ncbi:hypothetical protein [Bosea sp. BK604]|uniref:hypothetical protein n=1 Tax=Bosea sp. BK604 TaxID=2512180 RepID=UPI0010D9B8AF|nr:hypothetical protein [Bosea sp. BK604]TCR70539.1 hypothetical protein EV560_101946 [Bosea sp. BK604]
MSANRPEFGLCATGWTLRTSLHQEGKQVGIKEVAIAWTLLWRASKAMGATYTAPASFPFSHPLHLMVQAGSRLSDNALTLNPRFTDWIMGWPIGWTNPEQPVTGFAAWLQRSRIELLRRLSARASG